VYSFFTKVWMFLLFVVVLVLAFSLTLIVLIGAGILALLTLPYILYVRWKAKKELEKESIWEVKVEKFKE